MRSKRVILAVVSVDLILWRPHKPAKKTNSFREERETGFVSSLYRERLEIENEKKRENKGEINDMLQFHISNKCVIILRYYTRIRYCER